LAEEAATGSSPVRDAARHSLDTLRGEAVNETMGKLLAEAAPDVKAELTRSLAARRAAAETAGIGAGGAGLIALTRHPDYEWQQTDSTIALLNHDRTVWQFNYGKDARKPYFHPVALADGTVLTCLSPRDHPWHLAMWFSWDKLNGAQYWEYDPDTKRPEGHTEVVDSKITPHQDHSATIMLTLTYHTPDAPPVLTEKRKITVSSPDKDGRYHIDWEAGFAAGKEDVLLQGGATGGGYAGLSVRIAQATKDWRIIDSEGRADVPIDVRELPKEAGRWAKNTHGQKARWMDFSMIDNATGDVGGLAILQHPSTFRFAEAHWHNLLDDTVPFGFFNPAPLWAEPYTLGAGKTLKVSYRVLVHPGRGSKDQFDAEWEAFSGSND